MRKEIRKPLNGSKAARVLKLLGEFEERCTGAAMLSLKIATANSYQGVFFPTELMRGKSSAQGGNQANHRGNSGNNGGNRGFFTATSAKSSTADTAEYMRQYLARQNAQQKTQQKTQDGCADSYAAAVGEEVPEVPNRPPTEVCQKRLF